MLSFNFNLLLASVLVILSCSGDVQAAPSKRSAIATLPIQSLHKPRSDIHPAIYLAQHINRSNRRLARMTGRAAPSREEARSLLQKRIDSVHAGYAAGLHSHSKRYVITDPTVGNEDFAGGLFISANRQKDAQAGASSTSNAESSSVTLVPGSGTTTSTSSTTSTEVGQGGSAAAAAAANGTAAGTAAGTASNSAGVSPVDIQAAQAGGLTAAGTPTASQSIGLDIEANDVGYIGKVQIGTPPRDFKMLMDSGSSDFWVGGETCTSQAGGTCGNHQFLGTKSSSTFVASTQNFKVTYGTGNVAGTIIKDDVTIAGLPLKQHTFGVATSESVDFSSNDTPFDGLIGLAQQGLSQQKTATPPDSLAQQGTIQEAIVAYKISRLSDQKNDGEISFGGVDSTKFDQNTLVTINNVNPQGFWEAPMVATVNGKSVGIDTGRTAILDSGTTLIIAPTADATTIHQNIQGAKQDAQNGFTVPCTMTEVITMQFGGQNFDINPADVAFLPVNAAQPAGDCISGIQAGQIGGAQEWLVGDVFLKNAYFVTNVNKNTVSLAKLK